MPTKLERQIIDRVIYARESAGVTREEAGDALDLEEQSYGHYERGRYAFTVEQLFILSRRLRHSVQWFLGLTEETTADEDELLTLYRQIRSTTIRGGVLDYVRTQHALDAEIAADR